MTSLLGVADEDYIGVLVAADDGESFAVLRPIEIADEFGLEVSERFSRRTVALLKPQIVGIAVTYGIRDGFAVPGEADRAIAYGRKLRAGTLKFYKPGRLAGIERQQDELLLGVTQAEAVEGGKLTIRGDGDAAENRERVNRW